MTDTLINARLDQLTAALDHTRERLNLTNGELLVWTTLLMAALLKEANDSTTLNYVLGIILYGLNNKDAEQLAAFQALCDRTRVSVDVSPLPTEPT